MGNSISWEPFTMSEVNTACQLNSFLDQVRLNFLQFWELSFSNYFSRQRAINGCGLQECTLLALSDVEGDPGHRRLSCGLWFQKLSEVGFQYTAGVTDLWHTKTRNTMFKQLYLMEMGFFSFKLKVQNLPPNQIQCHKANSNKDYSFEGRTVFPVYFIPHDKMFWW